MAADVPRLVTIVHAPGPDAVDVILPGLERLCVLTDLPSSVWGSDPILPQIGTAGGVDLAATALSAIKDDRVLLAASTLIRQLSRSDINKTYFTCEIVEGISRVASTSMAHYKVVENLCSTLSNVSNRSENKPWVGRWGLPVLLQAASTFPGELEVNEILCISLRSLCVLHEVIPLAVAGGCVGLLVQAMKNHGSHADVTRFGLHALIAIVSNGEQDVVSTALSQALALNAVSVVAAAAAQHVATNKDTANCVADIARRFLGHPLGRDALVADPAVLPLLAKVLQSHSSLSASAGEVFYHLVTASPMPPPKALLTLVAKTGHVRCVVALMGAVRSQELAKWGTKTLMDLAFDGRHRRHIGAEGAIAACVEVMQLYEDDEEIQAAGLGVFWLAAFHSDNKPIMGTQENLQRVMTRATQRFRANNAIAERAQATLFLLRPS